MRGANGHFYDIVTRMYEHGEGCGGEDALLALARLDLVELDLLKVIVPLLVPDLVDGDAVLLRERRLGLGDGVRALGLYRGAQLAQSAWHLRVSVTALDGWRTTTQHRQ